MSTLLLQARVTLYAVDPLGNGQLPRGPYYKQFLKGVTKPNDVHLGNFGLQVTVMQTGGVVHDFTNDIAGVLQKCVADAAPYYETSFEPPPAAHPDEYHLLEITLAKPGLAARTCRDYYAQPSSHN
jgi:hypothetical protein